jgi:stage II sporulation protein D
MSWRSCSAGAVALFLLLGWLGTWIAWADEPAGILPRQPVVHIGLLVDAGHVIISCNGKMRIWRRGTGLRGTILGPSINLRFLPTRVASSVWEASDGLRTLEGWGISVAKVHTGQLGVFAEELVIEPISPGEPLRVEGRPYAGEMIIRVSGPDALTVVNALHIEDYLEGVVPAEMGRDPGIAQAALEAQAIAARSYALYHMGRHGNRGFDLYAGVMDQAYAGVGGETEEASRAVRATEGVVAIDDGRTIRANYCSTCGGITEASGTVWPGEDFPYMRGVRDRDSGGALCRESHRYEWTETWDCDELERIILRYLPEEVPEAAEKRPMQIEGLKIKRRSKSGRVEILEIKTDKGKFQVRGDRIRWILRRSGDLPLWSTLFGKLKKSRENGSCTLSLEGRGYGHGAGLCQYGAMALARKGRTTSQILAHYYHGIRLAKWW